MLSSAKKRRERGYEYAKQNYDVLISGLQPGESIKFVTHSMGAAFAEGMADFLTGQGESVSMIIHFEPYQAEKICSIGGKSDVLVIDIQTQGDWVINIFDSGSIQDADYKHQVLPDSDPGWQRIHTYALSEETWNEIIAQINEFLSK